MDDSTFFTGMGCCSRWLQHFGVLPPSTAVRVSTQYVKGCVLKILGGSIADCSSKWAVTCSGNAKLDTCLRHQQSFGHSQFSLEVKFGELVVHYAYATCDYGHAK